jgi:cation:H+ antiporter
MPNILSILVILVASIALIKGVKVFISSATLIAHHLKISEYTIGFLLVAMGTSLPEVVVAINAGVQKNTILSFGDALGSNIALVTLVVALPTLFAGSMSTKTIINSKDIYYTALFAILPITLIIDGVLTRVDGSILLGTYFIYAAFVLRRAHGVEKLRDIVEKTNMWKQVVLFLFSLVVLLVTSHLIVQAAISLSLALKISIGFVGLSLTALSTSLPEIAFTIAAVKRNKHTEVLGDIIGSVVANSTLVLGIASIIYPIDLGDSNIGTPTLFFTLLAILVFLRLARTKERITRVEALALIGLYVLVIVTTGYLQIG